jgi:aspartate aminotransferase
MQLTALVRGIQLSRTLALDARAKARAAAGRDVINMAVGEPDFPAPEEVRIAACERITSGDVKYTPAAGAPETRKAIAAHLSATRGTPYAPEEVVVCHSAKHALSGALYALAGPGDEVLIPLPAWVSYVDLVKIAGATPVPVAPFEGVRPDFRALEAAITPRTRVILFNSPCNPSGYVWTRAETERVAELAVRRDLALISDEIYRRLVYEGEPAHSPASLGAQARERTVIVDGASKSFAMTGYRIGYLAGPRPVIDAVTRLHSQTTGAPNTVSQAAYTAALLSEPREVAAMVREFAARRDLCLAGLERIGLKTPVPRGAFYLFPDVSAYLDARGSAGFCEDLLEAEDLALVPGAAFGEDRHVRLSYALGQARIREALVRLERFLAARPRR